MKYVKFVTKPNQWFKAGTEVLFEDRRRMTLDEYQYILDSPYQAAGFVGIRVCEDNDNERNFSEVGEERLDGEWCSFDEFDIEFVNEDITGDQWLQAIGYDKPNSRDNR
jgi:hypothetical protein